MMDVERPKKMKIEERRNGGIHMAISRLDMLKQIAAGLAAQFGENFPSDN